MNTKYEIIGLQSIEDGDYDIIAGIIAKNKDQAANIAWEHNILPLKINELEETTEKIGFVKSTPQ